MARNVKFGRLAGGYSVAAPCLHRPGWLSTTLAIFVVAVCLYNPAVGGTAGADYATEKAELEARIAQAAQDAALKVDKVRDHAYLVYRRAALSGAIADIREAQRTVARALEVTGPSPDLFQVRAALELKLHRTAAARETLAMVPEGATDSGVLALQGDLATQEGKRALAGVRYKAALQKGRSWDNLCRVAFWEYEGGNYELADALYVEAEEEITAKEMRSYAWVEVQRGWLAFRRGRFEVALSHYARADKAYSGYWLVHDHLAELNGAMGRFVPAVSLYQRAIAEGSRPEIQQALGELYVFMGQPDLAQPWLKQALNGYLESVRADEIVYCHHLAGYYSDVIKDPAEAVKWAQRDTAERRNPASCDTLAWALYGNGQFALAASASDEALASGTKDPHILFHAAMIYLAASRPADGRNALAAVAAVDPSYATTFHAHR